MLAKGGLDLTLTLLTWTIWRAPTNASKWRMGFNSAFKRLILPPAPVAVENSEESLPKLPIHEAVRDRVTAGTDVGEQLH